MLILFLGLVAATSREGKVSHLEGWFGVPISCGWHHGAARRLSTSGWSPAAGPGALEEGSSLLRRCMRKGVGREEG